MSTADIVAAAVLFGPAALGGAAYAWTLRGAASDSAAVRQVIAEYDGTRPTDTEDGGTPPPEREPAPDIAPAPVACLTTVIPFPDRRAA